MSELILFNKPYRVLSQFTDRENPDTPRTNLSDYLEAPGFRVAGRLDYDSEGLLLLTNDGTLQQQIANPRHKQWKTYWVQVEGEIDIDACESLAAGVLLKDGVTQPARAKPIAAPTVWPRHPPIRVRQTVTDSWLELAIQEGRNRQIRRMTAAIGFPTLRLIRIAVGRWRLDHMPPGEHRRVTHPR